ncbi:MAG TPA: GntR family transcriptional regulator [Streptosporangiaceae bacterium]|nr:GntR family transcriptional regulator [Streptosporangiaceae bacterium]
MNPVDQLDEGVRRQVLSDGVYVKLKAQLMEHIVEPGARLGIDALARRFQVLQTLVREALARLESESSCLGSVTVLDV